MYIILRFIFVCGREFEIIIIRILRSLFFPMLKRHAVISKNTGDLLQNAVVYRGGHGGGADSRVFNRGIVRCGLRCLPAG